MTVCDTNLVWLDLEMTGLDIDNDLIIEIATIVTDKDLNTLAEGPVFAIHHPDTILAKMDEWNTKQHGKSGLTERVKNSSTTEAQAEKETLDFISQYVPKGKSPICGNSICQDRRFLYRHMPTLETFFHYRNLDVSVLKVLAQLWKPKIAKEFNKTSAHTALSDIKDSIEELKFYREKIFLPSS